MKKLILSFIFIFSLQIILSPLGLVAIEYQPDENKPEKSLPSFSLLYLEQEIQAELSGALPSDKTDVRAEKFQANLERWRKMSPESKARLKRLYQKWRSLSPQWRQWLREQFQRFRNLPPEKQQALRKLFRKLSSQVRRRLHQWLQESQKMPRHRRVLLARVIRYLEEFPPEMKEILDQFIPPEQRRMIIKKAIERYFVKWMDLTPEQRKEFVKLSPHQRWKRIRQWLKENHQPCFN